MRKCVVLLVLLTAAVAEAKPLPAGTKVVLKKGKPYLSRDGVTVQLLDNWNEWSDLVAELSDDGTQLALRHGECGMGADDTGEPTTLALTAVDAKVENAKGMALHLKKKYADAAKLFEQATKHDPSTPVYATNWLSALVMGGDVAGANTLLEGGLGKDQIAWFAWRLAVDPELKKLKDQPGAKKFRADKPGTLTAKKLAVATSPLGVVAIDTSDSFDTKFVSFVQLSTGNETMRLPMKQAKQIDATLAAMGFSNTKSSLKWGGDIDPKLFDKIEADAKAVADIGSHLVYIYRSGGCDVAEFDFHAAAQKK